MRRNPVVPVDIGHVVLIARGIAAVGVAAIASTKEGAEGAASRVGDNSFVSTHVAELGSAAEDVHMAIDDGGAEVARYRLGGVKATGVELTDVCVLDEPGDVAGVVCTIGFADALHGSTADGAEATAVDVALGVVCVIVKAGIGYIKSREVELIEIATSNRYG